MPVAPANLPVLDAGSSVAIDVHVPDGQRVVFVATDDPGRTPVWLAWLNGRAAPRRLSTIDGSRHSSAHRAR